MRIKSSVIWSIALLSLLLGIVLTVSGALETMDRDNTDRYHVLSGVRHQATSTAIASLDAESLELYPNTPLVFWGPHFAKAIRRLKEAGAAAVALDIYFAITPEQWLRTLGASENIPPELVDYDQTFDQALSEGHVILAANPIRGKNGTFVPLPAEEYLAALPNHLEGVGLTTLQKDSDARIRWMVLAFEGLPPEHRGEVSIPIPDGYKAPNPWLTFAALAVKEGFGANTLASFQGRSIFSPRLIAYCGPPMTIPRISLVSLLREKGLTPAERTLVAGRIVFIGSDSESFGDRQPTPYSRSVLWREYRDMSGAEIHANIAETILNPNRIQTVPLVLVFLLWGLIMALAAISCELHIKPMAIYVMKLTSLLVLWPIGLVSFLFGYLFPQAGCFSSIMFFFVTIAILRTIGAHDRTIRIIEKTPFKRIYHDR